MNQIEQLECEIEELKIELQRSQNSVGRIKRTIQDKESQLYFKRMKDTGSGDDTLKYLLDLDGFLTDTCNNICSIVTAWLPDKIECESDDYSKGWDDCVDYLRSKIK